MTAHKKAALKRQLEDRPLQPTDSWRKIIPTDRTSSPKLSQDPEKVQRVLDRVSEGESLRNACREEGASRSTFLRMVARDPEFAARFAFSTAARAHAIVDRMEQIADGSDVAEETAREVLEAVRDLAPAHVEAVTRALLKDRVNRDRLRFDAARWVASRTLPAVYGAGAAQGSSSEPQTIRIVFDAPPAHMVTPQLASPSEPADADYEIVEDGI